MSEGTFAHAPVEKIRINKESLREVDPKNPQFIELVDNVKVKGVLLPIRVTKGIDPETKEEFFGLIDGLQRLSAAKLAGLTTVPAYIVEAEEVDVLYEQIMTNAIGVDTKPAEFAKQIHKLMALNPMLTVASLALKFGKSDAWLKQVLNLTKLTPEAASLVDEGVINVSSAAALSLLPTEEQNDWLEKAQTLTHSEFVPMVKAHKKALDEARRKGKAAADAVFEAQPHLQKIGDIKTEVDTQAVAAALIASERITTPEAAFKMALQWVLHLDPMSVADAKVAWEEQRKTAEAKRAKANEEREEKKLQAANIKAERAALSLKVTREGGDVVAALKEFDEKHGLNKKPN